MYSRGWLSRRIKDGKQKLLLLLLLTMSLPTDR
jgi:hypothetical protein